MLQDKKDMKKLWLSEKMVARSFWKELRNSVLFEEAEVDSREICRITAPLVDKFPSVAGSIGKESCTLLWLITKYFSPRIVGEVGTYIGRSTLAMSFGGKSSIENLYTCDGTYDSLDLGYLKGLMNDSKKNALSKIKYFGKQMSYNMFSELIKNGVKLDLLFVDGRLGQEDLNILKSVMAEDCVVVLDDFEGVEKGVVNGMMLRNLLKNYILLEPFVNENHEVLNLSLMVPGTMLSLSRQQSLPVNM